MELDKMKQPKPAPAPESKVGCEICGMGENNMFVLGQTRRCWECHYRFEAFEKILSRHPEVSPAALEELLKINSSSGWKKEMIESFSKDGEAKGVGE